VILKVNGGQLNVNNYWDDNRNDNIGVSASRKSTPHIAKRPIEGRLCC
jgi:hypothetical protein